MDCAGDLVIPGLVELHTDNVERHIEPHPEVDWPHLPALIAHDAELASTGITTVFDAMRVGSIHSGKGRYIDYARKLADELLAARAQGYFKISHFLLTVRLSGQKPASSRSISLCATTCKIGCPASSPHQTASPSMGLLWYGKVGGLFTGKAVAGRLPGARNRYRSD